MWSSTPARALLHINILARAIEVLNKSSFDNSMPHSVLSSKSLGEVSAIFYIIYIKPNLLCLIA